MTDSAIARQAVTEGLPTEKELREIAEGWRRWATHPDAWFAVLHGEISAAPSLQATRYFTLFRPSVNSTYTPQGSVKKAVARPVGFLA